MELKKYFHHLALETGAKEFSLVTDHARSKDSNNRNLVAEVDAASGNIIASMASNDEAPIYPARRESSNSLNEKQQIRQPRKRRNYSFVGKPVDSLKKMDPAVGDNDAGSSSDDTFDLKLSPCAPKRPERKSSTDDMLLQSPALVRLYELRDTSNVPVVSDSYSSQANAQFEIHLDPVGYQHYKHRVPLPTADSSVLHAQRINKSRVLRRNSINSGYTSSIRHKLQSRWDTL